MWQIYEAYIEFVNINNLSIFTRIANRIANSKILSEILKLTFMLNETSIYANYINLKLGI